MARKKSMTWTEMAELGFPHEDYVTLTQERYRIWWEEVKCINPNFKHFHPIVDGEKIRSVPEIHSKVVKERTDKKGRVRKDWEYWFWGLVGDTDLRFEFSGPYEAQEAAIEYAYLRMKTMWAIARMGAKIVVV